MRLVKYIISLRVSIASKLHLTGADNFCWFLWIDKEKAYAFLMRMPLSILF